MIYCFHHKKLYLNDIVSWTAHNIISYHSISENCPVPFLRHNPLPDLLELRIGRCSCICFDFRHSPFHIRLKRLCPILILWLRYQSYVLWLNSINYTFLMCLLIQFIPFLLHLLQLHILSQIIHLINSRIQMKFQILIYLLLPLPRLADDCYI